MRLDDKKKEGIETFLKILNNNPHYKKEEKKYMYETLTSILNTKDTDEIKNYKKLYGMFKDQKRGSC